MDETLPPSLRYQDGLFVGQDQTQIKTQVSTAPRVQTEADNTQGPNIGDAYGATPPPLQRQTQAAPSQVPAGNDAILQDLLATLSEEHKSNIIKFLTQGNAAQVSISCPHISEHTS